MRMTGGEAVAPRAGPTPRSAGIQEAVTQSTAASRIARLARLEGIEARLDPRAGIEGVPDPVAEEVEPEDQEGERGRRTQAHPARLAEEHAGIGQDVGQARCRRRRAE